MNNTIYMHYILSLIALTLVVVPTRAFAQTSTPSRGLTPTFNSTQTDKTPPSKDKSMGFGKRLRTRLNAKRARQSSAPASVPSDTPMPDPSNGSASNTDLGYYYIEQGESEMAKDYLDDARDYVNTEDGDGVLELFELYALLAYEEYADGEGDDELAESYLELGEEVLFDYLETGPNDYEAAYVMGEVASLYYELADYTMASFFYAQTTDYTLDPMDAYMAASASALDGDSETALGYLELALDLGFLDEECIDIDSDSDLESLRGMAEYEELRREYGF